MKEKIYTIPVTEVFAIECECPVCLLEKKLEDEYIGYFLGASLMEPDCRIVTNDSGFCRRHFELLYNRQENRLGLGLTIDTHLQEQIGKLEDIYGSNLDRSKGSSKKSFIKYLTGKMSSSPSDSEKLADEVLSFLNSLESKCSVCNKLDHTMDRYMDVIMYLWSREADFKRLFNTKKGFCMKHFKQMLEATRKYLKPGDVQEFTNKLIQMQLINLARVQQEVDWFTKKFDYRNNDAPWENSKDALIRSIQKLVGYCDLK